MVFPLIHAHRGASAYRPENTLAAFELAIEMGADAIELDVHFSKDGEVVVAHDERLDRVSDGTGLINDYTLAELKKFNFNKLFPEQEFAEIPTLREVYALIKPSSLRVNCEFKTTLLLYPGLVEATIKIAREFQMTERVMYSSFNHYSLLEVKQYEPTAEIGLLYELGMVDPWVYANYCHAEYIHPIYLVIAALPETVAKCHENGVKVNVWTPDDPKMIGLLFQAGVDGVITNKPDVAKACRDAFDSF